MDFYMHLKDMDKMSILEIPTYKSPTFSRESELLAELERIIKLNLRVLVYGDYDPDGATCFLLLKRTFELLGFSNFEIFRYTNRTHDVDPGAVSKAVSERFDYMIICDAGSQDPGVIRRLNTLGVKTILLDHHESPYSYEDFAGIMINTTFENRINAEELILSAGALTYIVCEKLLRRFGIAEDPSLVAIAVISMYADSVDMSSELGRALYYKAMEVPDTKLPKFAQHFLTEHTRFNRRFIEFTLIPKLNSLFRAENFDLLNRYLLWKPGSDDIGGLVERITEFYAHVKNEINKASDIIATPETCEVLNNFVIGNLSSVANQINIPAEGLHHYTGLIANTLAAKYRRTAIVFADAGHELKGSLRDLDGRNYLKIFSDFCRAGGHKAAFGIHLDYLEYNDFLAYVRMIDKQFFIKTVENKPIVIPHNTEVPNMNLISDMSMYNEFSGVSCPVALISKIWRGGPNPPPTKFGDRYYKWGNSGLSIKSRRVLMANSMIRIKPYRGKGIKLEVTDNTF